MEQSKRRRKKNVYVEYDYEEAYQKQIENLEEDIIKRMMDGFNALMGLSCYRGRSVLAVG